MDIPTPPLRQGPFSVDRSLHNPFIDLHSQHVASNPYTRYRPFPTSAQFAASPDLISRMTMFLRRELRVWPNLDVEVSFHPPRSLQTPRVDRDPSFIDIPLSDSSSQPTPYRS